MWTRFSSLCEWFAFKCRHGKKAICLIFTLILCSLCHGQFPNKSLQLNRVHAFCASLHQPFTNKKFTFFSSVCCFFPFVWLQIKHFMVQTRGPGLGQVAHTRAHCDERQGRQAHWKRNYTIKWNFAAAPSPLPHNSPGDWLFWNRSSAFCHFFFAVPFIKRRRMRMNYFFFPPKLFLSVCWLFDAN